MASYHDVLDAIARVRASTGDPDAWRAGLTGEDIATATNPISPPVELGAVLAKVTAAHPDIFVGGPAATTTSPPPVAEGAAADAIRDAQSALADQNSAAADVDQQVLSTVRDAQETHAEGASELDRLRAEIARAIAERSDLDTASGAREFQRFLISELRAMREVVENAGLDASSKAGLIAALGTLYGSSAPDVDTVQDREDPAREDTLAAPTTPTDDQVGARPDVDPRASAPGMPASAAVPFMPAPGMAAPAWTATAPTGGGIPASGPLGGLLPELSMPGLLGRSAPELVDLSPVEPHPDAVDPSDEPSPVSDAAGEPDPALDDRTAVTLPDGDTVTAPSPELATVVSAAVAGTPIPEAFSEQGIWLPVPGSAVSEPVDPARVTPGDIGLFADRYALVVGHGKVLVDGEMRLIGSVTGSDFLGWQHPAPPSPTTVPPRPGSDRPAATAPS